MLKIFHIDIKMYHKNGILKGMEKTIMDLKNTPTDKTLLAAIDLGSNSFRLEIGRLDGGHIERLEYLKEAVRQGGDLDENRNLTPESIERGIRCLARFGERL